MTKDTLPTIESFTKLQTFHAPYSAVTNRELERLAKLKQLRDLGIGVRQFDSNTLEILSSLGHLETLHLFIFETKSRTDAERTSTRQAIQNQIPHCEIKLHFVPTSPRTSFRTSRRGISPGYSFGCMASYS